MPRRRRHHKVVENDVVVDELVPIAAVPEDAWAKGLLPFSLRLLRRLPAGPKDDLGRWLRAGELSKVARLGTMRSGIDSPVICLRTLAKAFTWFFLLDDLAVSHVFSGDQDVAKQHFISNLFQSIALYANTACLRYARARNIVTCGVEVIQSCGLAVAGFPCKDVSFLNNLRKTLMHGIEEGSHKTGSAFADIMRFCALTLTLIWLILENVLGLKPQLRAVLLGLEAAGMWDKVFMLSPIMFGDPQTRPRFWIPSFRKSYMESLNMTLVSASTSLSRFLRLFVGHHVIPIDEIMLHESDRRVQRYYKNLEEDHSRDRFLNIAIGGSSSAPQWVEDTIDHLVECDRPWWENAQSLEAYRSGVFAV